MKIIKEFFTLFISNRGFPGYYFTRYLFKKDRTNIKDYFSNYFLTYKVKQLVNEEAVTEVVQNKLYFDFFYNQFKIRLPKILMYNHNKMFVVDNNYIEISDVHNFKLQLKKLFKKIAPDDSIIIKKTYESYGGNKIFKLFNHELSSTSEKINELYLEVIRTGYLFQEVVKQHPELNKLNPSCLNTIRLDTFIDSEGKVEIMSGFIRMSYSNSHVDNTTAGGCYVGVNLKNGTLKSDGYKTIRVGVDILTAHPITKTIFKNFSIPFFDEAKELVIRTAKFMPGLRLVGWDVAISESGPVLIEGNSNYNMDSNDCVDGGYRTNSTFRKFLKEFNYIDEHSE